MQEQMPTLDESFESRLFNAKMTVQIRLIEEEFGPQSENVLEIVSYLITHGSKINDIFHQDPSLVSKFTSDPDTVFNKVKKELRV